MIEASFPLRGATLPTDHGYALFGACSRALGPVLHGANWLAVAPVRGARQCRDLALTPASALRLRLPPERLPEVLPLAGRELEVDGHRVRLDAARVAPLAPARDLRARLVTVKGFTEPEPFAEALRRQLDALEVAAEVDVGARRVTRVAGDVVVGFAVELRGLDDAASLRVQAAGLGGRRRFGCGFFLPAPKSLALRRDVK